MEESVTKSRISLLSKSRIPLLTIALLFLLAGSAMGQVNAAEGVGEIAVGAYYLTGWGLISQQKSSDWSITAPFTPELGDYNSANSTTTNTHIEWALNHGVTFFVLPWTHAGYAWETALEDGFLKSESISMIKFAIMTNYVPFWSGSSGFPGNNDERISWMLDDIRYIVDNYAGHQSYLKVGDRPVLFVYQASTSLSNSLGGIEKLSQFIASVRTAARERGVELYIVGDVMYWRSLPTDESYAKIFDAVSAYTLPDAGVGWSSDNGRLVSIGPYDLMVQSYAEMNKYWSELTRRVGVGFIPPVTPGFNNTDTYQLGIDDYHVVRTDSTPEKFSEMVNNAAGYVDSGLNMMIVEAWNEYHEGSVVEPTKQFGFAYLDEIANGPNVRVVHAPEYIPGGQSLMLVFAFCTVSILAKKRSRP